MTQPDNAAEAAAKAEQLRQSAEQFVADNAPAAASADPDATRPMSLADLLKDDDK